MTGTEDRSGVAAGLSPGSSPGSSTRSPSGSPGPSLPAATGTAFVTGAARGIGAAVAERLAADGFRVVCADLCAPGIDPVLGYPLSSRADLDATVERIGPTASAAVLDVRDRAAVAAALDSVDDLVTVVTAAGVVWGGAPLWETPDAAWQAVFDVNVTGTFNVVSAAVPKMFDAADPGRCRIVAVASAGASRGLGNMAAYSASKHAVVGLVRSVAVELGGTGVTVNAVAPGSTRTRILEASADAYGLSSVEDFAEHHTTGRLVEPVQVADAVSWLCSGGAGAVTGSVLAVDAGMTAR